MKPTKPKNFLPQEIQNKIAVATQPIIKATIKEKAIYIASIEQNKLRNYSNSSEETNKFIDLIMRWKIYTGITNEINFTEFVIIFEFIRKNFGELNYTDIESAIDLSTANKLEIIKSKSDESFGYFSCAYVGRILSAYIEYRPKAIHKVKNQVDQYLLVNTKPEINYEERILNFQNLIIEAYIEVRKTKNYTNDWGNMIFHYLYKNDFLTFPEEQIKRSKKYAIKEAKSDSKKEHRTLKDLVDFLKNKDNKEISLSDKEIILYQKKYFVIEYFLSIKSIEKIVNSVTKETIDK